MTKAETLVFTGLVVALSGLVLILAMGLASGLTTPSRSVLRIGGLLFGSGCVVALSAFLYVMWKEG